MGGFGSGLRWVKKPTVERCTSLDTSDLKRLKLLSPGLTDFRGSLEWRRGEEKPSASLGYRITIGAEGGTLRLEYKMGPSGERLEYGIRLVATGCHLGGKRWWFRCPLSCNGVACGRRVRKVYLRGNYFGCRHCHGLTYRCVQQSDSRVYAALREGKHLIGVESVEGMSMAELGFTLRVLTAGKKRLERVGKKIDRLVLGRKPKPEDS